MSNAKNPNVAAHPPEPPELVAERDRLLPELEKQAKAATGTAQQVLRKMHELLLHTRPGSPMNFQLYQDVKTAFERFMKDPVLPPPAIIMQCVEFLQKRLVANGFTGQVQLPAGAPPPPAGVLGSSASAAPAAAAPSAPRVAKDGFEKSTPAQRPLTLNPEAAAPPATPEVKTEQQQLESFKTWMKNPHIGKVKG